MNFTSSSSLLKCNNYFLVSTHLTTVLGIVVISSDVTIINVYIQRTMVHITALTPANTVS